MHQFSSSYGTLILTEERLRHILTFHPDIRTCLQYFASTLGKPERVIPSVKDPQTVICYHYLPRRKKYLAIVIQTKKLFIITAYLAKKPKPGKL